MKFYNKRKNLINIALVVLYFVIHLTLIAHHEAWGDEAQAWVIAKNTSFIGLFPALCAEGHPAGWFILIKLVQKIGLSFYHFSLLSLLLMTASVAIILWFSPIPLVPKLIILLSSTFFYFNPVICRVYSLVVFLIILLSVFWEQRDKHSTICGIIIALLFQSHILMAGMACGLLLVMIIDYTKQRKSISGIIIASFGMVLTIFELFPRENVVKSVDYSISDVLKSLLRDGPNSLTLFPKQLFATAPMIISIILLIISIPILFYFFEHFNNYWDCILVLICAVGFIALVNASIYKITIHAVTLIPLIFFFIYSTIYRQLPTEKIKTLCTIFICILSIGTYHTWFRSARSDYIRDFSENKRMADYISDHNEKDSIIILKDEELARVGVYAYVSSSRPDIVFWCPDTMDEYSFFNWSVNVSSISNADSILSAAEHYPTCNNFYLLSWKEEYDDNLSLVFSANEFCEKNDPSWLYKFIN